MVNGGKEYKKLYEEALLTISEKEEIISDQQFELDKLRKHLFGFRSEKRTGNTGDDQLGLFELGVTKSVQEELSESVAEKPAPKKRAKGTGRMSLPEELRREEVVIEPSESTKGCTRIGEEVTEVLEVVPASFYVKRFIRPKYAYGMPLYRQIDKYSKMGVRIPASIASDWIMRGWGHLIPLWELLRLIVVSQKYLQVDETPIKVLDRDHEKGIHQGYMWLYHAPVDRLVVFDYRKGRDQSGAKEMLADFRGIIQTDGYKVYDTLFGSHPDIHLTFCMAHARRKFVDAVKDDEEQANYVLDEIGKLYLLEAQMRDGAMGWEQRTVLRKEHAEPVLENLGNWLEEKQYSYRPKSPMGQAIAYAHKRWAGLSAYVLHGQMEIDNNLVENAVRPLAVGRKAYLFAGSHQAAEMTAAMYSFMASCKKNKVNEFDWLKDVFERIQSHNQKDLYQLLPSNWEEYRPK